ncbi:RDD family protein [Streptomyces sp. PKU-EA00015]|uniref:RDD family protein n=1 Tax=Streptomyces sp. PKU-EA00015 TaxID=2748326 RepID=UPI0015A221A7|nr:RDD family protein [Streptomyces sp. PKU-EA00015]NWF30111.1 RDD family protein [Streptomyces sp. PKU-EA00015]
MSAPTPATGDSSPTPGYYPDPSIPGYVRYWNGAAWVPGTSRPAPKSGEEMPAPPASAAPAPARVTPAPPQAAVEETGPVFLDEEPDAEPSRPEPASAWQADAARQSGFGGDLDNRVSWGGAQDPRAADPSGAGASDPRRPAEPSGTVDPSGGQLPGMRSVTPQSGTGRGDAPGDSRPLAPSAADGPLTDGTVGIRAPRPGADDAGDAPASRQPAEHTVTIRAQRPGGPAAGGEPDGTMTIRSLGAGAGAGAGAAAPAKQPQPQPGLPAPSPSQPQPQAPSPAPLQRSPQPQAPAVQAPAAQTPVTNGPGGGAASWAQQVHQLAHSAQAPDAGQPVLPWKPPVEDPFLAAAQAQANARPASLGKRFAARLIDTLVLGALVGAVAVPVVLSALAHIDDKIEAAKLSGQTVTVWLIDGTTAGQLGIVLGTLLVLGALYEALPTAKWGRTLGKKLCGVKVLDIESHEPPTFGAALRRWLVYSVLGVLVLGVLNVLWCLFDRPWRQCWHDKAAHTFVTG